MGLHSPSSWPRVSRHGSRWRTGRSDSALADLEALRIEGWYELTFVSPFYSGAMERFTRAELLREKGRGEEALGWYRGLGQNTTQELVFLGPAMLAEARDPAGTRPAARSGQTL